MYRGMWGLGQGVNGASHRAGYKPDTRPSGGWGLGSVMGGIGKGLLGIVAKPAGCAAKFVSQTAQALIQAMDMSYEIKPFAVKKV